MKTKSLRNLTIMLLVALFAFSSAFSVNAADTDNDEDLIATPYYTTISMHTTYISISGITATCSTTLSSKGSTTLKIKMELQKKKSGVYETIETWSTSGTGTLLGMDKKRNINILCDYRLKATFKAGSETVISYDYP
ncbi:MAG: hypothetical protein PUE75_07345 [Eubacteriales bacterium]|nr:hypothetical protein [Eubacteriales bacterium]